MVVVCDEPTSLTDAYALIKILNREHGVFKFKIIANMVRNMREGQELFAKLVESDQPISGCRIGTCRLPFPTMKIYQKVCSQAESHR